MAESQRLPQLDGLRGIAILMVFLYHAANTRLPLFWSGVDLFFVLSGYLITGILLRLKERTIKEQESRVVAYRAFYARRGRRILPPYIGFLIAVSCFYSIPWARVWYFYLFFSANLAIVLHKVTWVSMVPLWSLAVEEQFYFVWPMLVFRARTATLKKVALGVIVIVPLLRATCTMFGATHDVIYFLAPFRIDTMAWGSFIAIAEYESPGWSRFHRPLAVRCGSMAAIVFFALSISPRFRFSANSLWFNAFGYSLVAVILAGLLIVALTTHDGTLSKVLVSKPLRYIGLISYTFYLYHDGVLSVLHQHLHSMVLSAFWGFVISGTIASLSWYLLEAPILGVMPDRRAPAAKVAAAT
jgi:peptidoglycan/LPS O-acetylase OafA/YrhL